MGGLSLAILTTPDSMAGQRVVMGLAYAPRNMFEQTRRCGHHTYYNVSSLGIVQGSLEVVLTGRVTERVAQSDAYLEIIA